jgi:hypothetical protein
MAKYSVVKIELKDPPGTEYKVYWDQSKHDHNTSTTAGTFAMQQLAAHLHTTVPKLNYRSGSFQSNQSSAPTGANIFQIT